MRALLLPLFLWMQYFPVLEHETCDCPDIFLFIFLPFFEKLIRQGYLNERGVTYLTKRIFYGIYCI